jgi:hypothetical protein
MKLTKSQINLLAWAVDEAASIAGGLPTLNEQHEYLKDIAEARKAIRVLRNDQKGDEVKLNTMRARS